jgi:hypothetical protein
MRRSRLMVMLAALVLGALLPLTSMASGTPVTYGQIELSEFNGTCAAGNVEMAGFGYGEFAGSYESQGYALTFMEPYGNFPHQVAGLTIYFTDPSQSEAFALMLFTGTLKCTSATEGYINGPVWSACVYDLDSGITYRGNGAGRNNRMDFGWDPSSGYGLNIAQYSGKLQANAQSCNFDVLP